MCRTTHGRSFRCGWQATLALRERAFAAISTFSEQGNGFQSIGAFAMGNRTIDPNNLPATATYSGSLSGQSVGASNTPNDTHSLANKRANFTHKPVSMESTSIISCNAPNRNPTPAPGLAFTGSGTLTGTSLQGFAAANRGGLGGYFSGDFHGSGGELEAGAFGMSGPPGTHVGAFNLLKR